MNYRKSFTLIEILVVATIIVIFSGIVLVSMKDAKAKARDARRISDLRQYQILFGNCYVETGSFPDCELFNNCDELQPGRYKLVSSCGCHAGDYQATVLSGCPSFTPSKLRNDPINWEPLAYFYFYFYPNNLNINQACRGKYVMMTNLEKTKPTSRSRTICTLPGKNWAIPDASDNSYWVILGP